MEVRAQIQNIVLEHRRNYGYRRVSRELKDQGMAVNHKRVLRILQQDNLLAVRRRKFILTTDSRHDLPVYLNLAGRMQLSGINQLWVADITYIRLREEFVYLAVVLDAFSRRVVGWAVDDSLHAPLAIAALRKAIAQRQPEPGLVHHSDRGIQYASSRRKSIPGNIAIAPIWKLISSSSWNSTTIASACMRRWATVPRKRSRICTPGRNFRPHR